MPLPDLATSIRAGIEYMDAHDITVPVEMLQRARRVGALKAGGDLGAINQQYHDAITQALLRFFEGSGPVTAPRNAFYRAMVNALGAAFDLGWQEGGGGEYPSPEANAWFQARIELEMGYIATLFQEAKELRTEEGFDYFSWITARADGYIRTVRELYNAGRLRAGKDYMVTFDGDDGVESCATCQSLKGQRHRVSWFVRRNYIPPHGTGLDCHPGRRCMHYLVKDNGERVTV